MLRAIVFLLVTGLIPSAQAESYQLVMPDMHGKEHKLTDYRGKWVVVNYWATWCPPCLDEIPELVEFHEKNHKSRAVVLGINYEEVERGYLKTFVEEYFINYPILIPDLKQTPPFGRILGLPTTYIVSPEGKLIETRIGGVTKEWLESVIKPVKVTSGQ